MFKVEIVNLSVYAVIGVSKKEREKKQLLKVSLSFYYQVAKNKSLNDIKNLKDYSTIIKFLKNYIALSKFKTLEKLISQTVLVVSKKFKLKNVKLKINKTKVAKKYGSDSLSVSN
tara:strand:- start:1 stop:345 length:345 start_codon:yes stop_codon:yes gene_type:complete